MFADCVDLVGRGFVPVVYDWCVWLVLQVWWLVVCGNGCCVFNSALVGYCAGWCFPAIICLGVLLVGLMCLLWVVLLCGWLDVAGYGFATFDCGVL